MLSKCANPECCESFRYLHEGKLFRLCPTPEVQIAAGTFKPALHERFWLCTRCSRKMTLVWEGTQVKLVPVKVLALLPPAPKDGKSKDRKNEVKRRLRARVASVGREDR